jgi:hypothetical protein
VRGALHSSGRSAAGAAEALSERCFWQAYTYLLRRLKPLENVSLQLNDFKETLPAARVRARMRAPTHARAHTCTHTHTHPHMHAHSPTHARTRTHTRTHTFVRLSLARERRGGWCKQDLCYLLTCKSVADVDKTWEGYSSAREKLATPPPLASPSPPPRPPPSPPLPSPPLPYPPIPSHVSGAHACARTFASVGVYALSR